MPEALAAAAAGATACCSTSTCPPRRASTGCARCSRPIRRRGLRAHRPRRRAPRRRRRRRGRAGLPGQGQGRRRAADPLRALRRRAPPGREQPAAAARGAAAPPPSRRAWNAACCPRRCSRAARCDPVIVLPGRPDPRGARRRLLRRGPRPRRHVHAIVGDVCGHGPDEAALGALLRVSWRALVLAGVAEEQLLPELQQVLVSERHDRGSSPRRARSRSTRRHRGMVRLAGHPPPVVLGRATTLDPPVGLPLGDHGRRRPGLRCRSALARAGRCCSTPTD